MIAEGDEYTPTPVISHAILTYNRGRKRDWPTALSSSLRTIRRMTAASNITPEWRAADATVTGWIEAKANALLEARLGRGETNVPRAGAARLDDASARLSQRLHQRPRQRGRLNVISRAKISLGVDPLGGRWRSLLGADLPSGMGLNLNGRKRDGRSHLPFHDSGLGRPDSHGSVLAYAMERLIGMKDRFDLSFACDTDYDRHGIVTKRVGLLPPNQLPLRRDLLSISAPAEVVQGGGGWKDRVSSAMIDRVTAKLGRRLHDCRSDSNGSLTACSMARWVWRRRERRGVFRPAGRQRVDDGQRWLHPLFAPAEITARTGRDPGEIYRELTREFGEPFYDRVEAPATPAEKAALAKLSPGRLSSPSWRARKSDHPHPRPGQRCAHRGLKAVTKSGWFAARPVGDRECLQDLCRELPGSESSAPDTGRGPDYRQRDFGGGGAEGRVVVGPAAADGK